MKLKKQNGAVNILVVIIIIAVIAIVVYLINNNSSIKNTVVTEDNYEELSEQVGDELEEDEAYYYLYACMYYVMTDGLSEEYLSSDGDESIAYQNIYGKTVGELVEEGEDLMEENDITVDEWKETMTDYLTEE